MGHTQLPFGMIVGRTMHEVFRVLRKKSSEEMETKLTIEQFGLLHAVNMKQEDMIQKDMAEMMGKDKSSILRIIDALEEKELVRRAPDKNDRRKNFVMVTKKGERVIDEYIRIEKELVEELQEGLTEQELQVFQKVLNHIRGRAESYDK